MKILFYFVSILLIMGCSNDDDNNSVQGNDSIIGEWELMYYFESNNQDLPPDGEAPVIISFTTDNFNGNTSVNTFLGTYLSENTDLTFLEFSTTEVNETEWGNRFYDSVNQSYNTSNQNYEMAYEVVEGNLIIEYIPNQFMFLSPSN